MKKNRAEVIAMSIFEFDEEKEWQKLRETEYQYGLEDGMQQGIQQGIQQSLKILIVSLKKIYSNIDEVYQAVKENDIYKDITKEQIEEYYN